MFRVKICGVTRVEDALMCVAAGADAIGVNFYRPSPRFVEAADARRIVEAVGDRALVVGVFVNETAESVESIARLSGIGAVQLSGDEPASVAEAIPRRILKVARAAGGTLAPYAGYPCESLLLDAHRPGEFGGTGVTLDWPSLSSLVAGLARPDGSAVRWILAGGLTPANVREAVLACRPFGVDTASGVESAPGVKDPRKVSEFIQNAKEGLSIAGT
jgi:phosphoribosylanthranilate isomerase